MRYIIGLVLTVALIILVFVLVLRGLGVMGGGGSPAQTDLADYAQTQTVMRMTVDGPVNLDREHRSVQVTVGRSSNVVNLTQGYNGQAIQSQTYDSNEQAYATFLRALQLEGYTRGDDNPERQDSRGYCPTGKVYTFEIITGSSTVQSYWTTSCGGGTFDGDSSMIRRLFRAQVPDYSSIIRGTGLN